MTEFAIANYPTNKNNNLIVSPDYKNTLRDQLGEALVFIENNATRPDLQIDLSKDPKSYRLIDVYPNYQNTRFVASRIDIPKIDIATATIRKPFRVFRDVLVDKKNGERVYLYRALPRFYSI